MKTHAMLGILTLLATPVMAADSPDIISAAQALADKPSYSWNQTVVVPPDSQFQPGPTDGKLQKDGPILVSTSFGGNDMKYAIQGTNGVIYSEDNGWQSLSELDPQGPGRFMGRMIHNFQTPAQQATNLLAEAKDITKDGDAYSGDLTDDAVKSMLTRRGGGGGGGGGEPPTVSNEKGSVKFWIADGVLTKYEFKVSGTVTRDGNDNDVSRDTTVAITNVGSTTVDLPDDAKKKLQ